MENEKPLAKFRRPPLIEVVHGVQFAPLPMTIIHPGLFYAKIKDKYPQTQTQPSLPPVREALGGSAPPFFPFGIFPQNNLPRAWFVSQDDTLLIQLQGDRLLLNWRRASSAGDYPHFEAVTQEFQRIYGELEAFVIECGLGQIQPNQCEMTYINHLEINVDSPQFNPTDFFSFWCDGTDKWNEHLEDVTFMMRFLIPSEAGGPIGRLTANCNPILIPNQAKKILQLDLTARGEPSGEGLPGVVSFHEIAHRHIVKCFSEITTASVQKKWERFQ